VNAEVLQGDEKLTANQLLKACSQADQSWIGYCNGYLTAVRDIMQREFGAGGNKRFCVKSGSGADELFEAYIYYQKAKNSLGLDGRGNDVDAFFEVSTAFSLYFKCD
jgi:hypothetical protein